MNTKGNSIWSSGRLLQLTYWNINYII
jgi:hypothetical protein